MRRANTPKIIPHFDVYGSLMAQIMVGNLARMGAGITCNILTVLCSNVTSGVNQCAANQNSQCTTCITKAALAHVAPCGGRRISHGTIGRITFNGKP